MIEPDDRTRRRSRHRASNVETLAKLYEYAAGKKGYLPVAEAIARLQEQVQQGYLKPETVPIRQLVEDVQEFAAKRMHEDDLLVRILHVMETYGASLSTKKVDDEVSMLAQLIEAEEQRLAAQAISMEIDFSEIPGANIAGGDQDAFELFARDFLGGLGYTIELGPGRGADAGRDLIVVGPLPGFDAQQVIRWCVSCKHFAHSVGQRSVTPSDEVNIADRVLHAHCGAFMGFYSTLPSSGLITRLDGLKQNPSYGKDYFIFDKGKIAIALLSENRLEPVLERYFPRAFRKKKRGEIEVIFELQRKLWEEERNWRIDEAKRRNDAVSLLRSSRQYISRITSAEQRRKYLETKFFEEEE